MQKVYHQLHPRVGSKSSQIHPIHGMGGDGKTQLALRYALEFPKDYQVRIWIDAASEEILLSDYDSLRRKHLGRIQKALGTAQASDDAVASEVISWLDHAKGEWLLLFDNADDIDLRKIRNLLTNSIKGHVVVTTRQSDGARISALEGIEVLRTTTTESLEIFLKNAPITNPNASQRNTAGRISQELGNLALAVEPDGE